MESNNPSTNDNVENAENHENVDNENNPIKKFGGRPILSFYTVNYSADCMDIAKVSFAESIAIHNKLSNFEKQICKDYRDLVPINQMVQKYGISKASICRKIEKIKQTFGIKSRNQYETIMHLHYGWGLKILPEVKRKVVPWLLMNDRESLYRYEIKRLIFKRPAQHQKGSG